MGCSMPSWSAFCCCATGNTGMPFAVALNVADSESMLAPDDVPSRPPKPTTTASLLTQATLATQTGGALAPQSLVGTCRRPVPKPAPTPRFKRDARWGDLAAVNPLLQLCESGSTVAWRCPAQLRYSQEHLPTNPRLLLDTKTIQVRGCSASRILIPGCPLGSTLGAFLATGTFGIHRPWRRPDNSS